MNSQLAEDFHRWTKINGRPDCLSRSSTLLAYLNSRIEVIDTQQTAIDVSPEADFANITQPERDTVFPQKTRGWQQNGQT